ncbi:protealysin inhibitor emfourin [Microvirga sp. KLBC 81]|uniref:protealysin inhibitor emfourin n=1 Tax=Microvirga sp. KLBC 81 TaxID=1862707 RepID=UPI001057D736|nr:protealysin inhibitor emfourin [Microvirga sp. KLBC 81]
MPDSDPKFKVTWKFGNSFMPAQSSTAQVPKDKEAEFEGLLERSSFFDLPSVLPQEPIAASAGNTKITVSDGQRTHTANVFNTDMTQELADLSDWIAKNLTPEGN